LEREMAGIEEETEVVKERTAEIREVWKKVASNVFASHGVRKEVYRRKAAAILIRSRDKKRRRREGLRKFYTEENEARESAVAMLREAEKLRGQARKMADA